MQDYTITEGINLPEEERIVTHFIVAKNKKELNNKVHKIVQNTLVLYQVHKTCAIQDKPTYKSHLYPNTSFVWVNAKTLPNGSHYGS